MLCSASKMSEIGTPSEIYEHPVDRFVADFIGETNFIEAEVTQRIGNKGEIRLPSGIEVPRELGAQVAVGGKVTLAIRPERIDLVRPGADCHLAGKVENIVWQTRPAPPTEYECRLGDALEQVFAIGAVELSEIVAKLNELGLRTPHGLQCTEETLQPALARMALLEARGHPAPEAEALRRRELNLTRLNLACGVMVLGFTAIARVL